MNDPFLDRLKEEIARCEAMLEPLETGRLQIGETADGKTWTDRTQAQIDQLNRVIKDLKAVVERG